MAEIIDGIRAATSKGTTGKILSLVASRPAGRILDAPAGRGALSKQLKKTQHQTTALNLDDQGFEADNVPLVHGDLNQVLPFDDNAFDYVTCVDGIEHLENVYFTLREFARILKPGGELFISTPNISAFRSRWRYLLTGFHNKGKIPLEEEAPDPFDHINLLTFHQLRYGMRRAGFHIHEITANRTKLAAWPSLLLYPFAAACTAFAFMDEKNERQRELNQDIFRQMLSWPITMGETMIVSAIKEPPLS